MLTGLGLGGWACVSRPSKDGSVVTLGFDTIGRPCRIATPGELSLLRMALDTIVHGLTRYMMENERAWLETHLRRARLLERIGTFTSGIAHNFNNILGGILGHSELMEERLGTDARLTRHLASIRSGAERARDLIDQILAFGRRRDARPSTLNAQALVTRYFGCGAMAHLHRGDRSCAGAPFRAESRLEGACAGARRSVVKALRGVLSLTPSRPR